MRTANNPEQYIFQCRLLSEDEQEQEEELAPHIKTIWQGSTHVSGVIRESAAPTPNKPTRRRFWTSRLEKGEKGERLEKGGLMSVTLQRPDIDALEHAARIFQYHLEQGSISHLTELLESDAQAAFQSLKDAVKPHKASGTQYEIAQKLNAIEERTSAYPLVSPKQAAMLMGDVSATNPSRLITKAKQEQRLFVFYFGDSKTAQIPAFQFDSVALGVYKVVPALCQILDDVNDWGVYHWFTTYSDDLSCTPAQAIERPELESDLLYLAGLFKSRSTLRDLSFTASEAGDVNE